MQLGSSSTDVAARGVHVDDVQLVVHVDPPAEHKAYLHRSGRTARAGSAGDVVTVVLPEQRRDTAVLLRKADIKVTPVRVTSTSPQVAELVGEQARYVEPVKVAPQQQPRQGGSRQGSPRQHAAGGGRRRRPAGPATSQRSR